jgi:hypothetical protein
MLPVETMLGFTYKSDLHPSNEKPSQSPIYRHFKLKLISKKSIAYVLKFNIQKIKKH